jgi:hypothetical protein
MNSVQVMRRLLVCAALLLTREVPAQGVVPNATPASALAGPSANKVVVDHAQTIHLVYVDSGGIFYRSSVEGNTWSAPDQVSATGSAPAVAVDANRTVGVVFIENAQVKYRYKNLGGSWSAPVMLSSSGAEVAIAALGDKVHIVYSQQGPGCLSYRTLPTSQPSAASAPESLPGGVLCGCDEYCLYPSIAAAPGQQVRASYQVVTGCAPNCDPTYSVRVSRRDPPNLPIWEDELTTGTYVWNTSLAATPAGEYYLGFGSHLAKYIPVSATNQGWNFYQEPAGFGEFVHVAALSPPGVATKTLRVVATALAGGTVLREYRWLAGPTPFLVNSETIGATTQAGQALFFNRERGCRGRTQCSIAAIVADASPPQIRPLDDCGSFGPPILHYKFDSPAKPGYDEGNTYNVSSVAATVHPGVVGASLGFSGTNGIHEFSHPHVTALDLIDSMTGIAWALPAGAHTPDNVPAPCSGTVLTKGGNYWLRVLQDNSGLEFQHGDLGGSGLRVSTAIHTCEWQQLAFTRLDGPNIALYKNASLVGTRTISSPAANTSPFEIGNFSDDPDRCEFNGLLDEIKIFDTDCSATDLLGEREGARREKGRHSPFLWSGCALGPTRLGWASTAPPATQAQFQSQLFDVVMGDLGALRATGGDFSSAVMACLMDDGIDNSVEILSSPAPGTAFFYLVRETVDGETFSYDDGGGRQVTPRDYLVDASVTSCSGGDYR